MKTIRTILATFGVTTLVYGIFAMLSVRLDLTFTGRSIYQMFRSTGFAGLVLGIGCLLSVIILSIALAAFKDEEKLFRDEDEDDEEDFYSVAEEAEESSVWTEEIKQKQREALPNMAKEEEVEETGVDLFGEDDEDEEDEETAAPRRKRCLYCGAEADAEERVCPTCGKRM